MSEVVQETHQEFWRPPTPLAADEIVAREPIPSMAEACRRCGTEFLLGSRFCHACGGRRPEAMRSADARADAAVMARLWEQAVTRVHSVVAGVSWNQITLPAWLRFLHFHEIKSWVGLSTASLIAFTIGIACVAGALSVGLLTAQTFVDWQAIQFYRVEWLLAATAAFVAGILLKKPSGPDND
jgi:ribosomal protein L37E